MSKAPNLQGEIANALFRYRLAQLYGNAFTVGGSGIGVLFRITKKSIIKAASAGWSCKQVTARLRQVVKKDVPGNVDHEIKGWFQQCRRVAMRSSIIMQCPDKETTSRVLSAGGRQVETITDTIMEFKDRASQSALVRKLRDSGIHTAK